MAWYVIKIKGNGMKPITGHSYVEADGEAEAEQLALDVLAGEYGLFGVSSVDVTRMDATDEEEIKERVQSLGGYNSYVRADGTYVGKSDLTIGRD